MVQASLGGIWTYFFTEKVSGWGGGLIREKAFRRRQTVST